MSFSSRLASSKSSFGCFCILVASIMIGPFSSQASAEGGFGGPSFRKGMWHFVRTLELVTHRKTKHRLQEREMTRCVDPTVAMKATFSSPSVGSCVTATPEKFDNKYTFANRCDFMGPVSTVITVHSDEAYTELNEVTVGKLPRQELVVAKRLGDCTEDPQRPNAQATLSH